MIFKKDIFLKGRVKRSIEVGNTNTNTNLVGSSHKKGKEDDSKMDEEERIEYKVLPHKIRFLSTSEYK